MSLPTAFKIGAIAFGILIALLTPPFQSPDEHNHFFRAWQIAEGNFLPEKTSDQRLGGNLPSSLAALRDSFIFLKNDHAARTDFQKIKSQLSQPLRPADRQFLDFPNTAIYAPTAYLPQAVAIFIGKKLAASPLANLYFSRIANLFVWTFFVAAAQRMLPAGRLVFAVLALLPASLAIAASANADVFSNALCFWTVAFCLKNWLANPASQAKKIWLPMISILIVGLNKLIFAPIALLFLEKKQLKKSLLAAATVFAAAIFWAKTANQFFIPFDNYHPEYRATQTLNEGVQPAAQLDFILQNPLKFLKIAVSSTAEALPSTAAHLVGKFGWEKNYLPAWSIAALWLAVLVTIFFEKIELKNGQRRQLAAVAALCFGLFLVSNFCLWHPVGASSMGNFQGRYFVPLALLLAVASSGFSSEKLTDVFKKQIFRAVGAVLLLGNLLLLRAIFERYFF